MPGGRPRLGASARNIRAQLRLTEGEEEYLVLKYGSTGRGLRVLLDRDMGTQGVSSHRHARHTLLGTKMVAGAKVEKWACLCGKEMV